MQASDILFRCSSLHHLMTEPRSKSESGAFGLSESAKTHLIDTFVSAQYKRREEISGKMLEKGNSREEDSITLLSRVSKIFFKKNDVRLSNDYITGEPDIFLGESINNASETFDTKTSWSAHTFFRSKHKPLDKAYFYQGHGYMDLTGAKKHTVAFCLVNSPANLILDEKKRLVWSMGIIDPEQSEEYKLKCRQIEINHIFDIKAFEQENPFFEFHSDLSKWEYDIPMKHRLHTFSFDRDELVIEAIHYKIEAGRKWIETNLFID